MTEFRVETQTTSAALFVGTTVRYGWRDGVGLATVTRSSDDRVAFSGPDCKGRYTCEQSDWLFATRRLEIVLDGEFRAARRRRQS